MAFKWFLTSGENCDKCKKVITIYDPGIQIEQSDRHEKNVLYMHIKCLERITTEAIQRHKEAN
jgi:hypothetical protein